MRAQRGFTLLELMVVVIIIGILVAVALPSYRQYIVRTHRTDAKSALLDLAGRQERYFYSNNAYATSLSDLGSSNSAAGEYYTLSIDTPAGASSTNYVLTATAQGTQQRDDALCQTLALNRAGQFSSTGSTTNDPKCWGGN
jgi:type IV pilus assembly protein PilE